MAINTDKFNNDLIDFWINFKVWINCQLTMFKLKGILAGFNGIFIFHAIMQQIITYTYLFKGHKPKDQNKHLVWVHSDDWCKQDD